MNVDGLFEELVSRWSREEPLRVDELLDRAGPNAEALARLIDVFLERAPRHAPTPEARAAVAALAARVEHEPPLLAARLRARRPLSEIVDAIVAAAQLPVSADGLVQSYYQRLEGGLLDPRGVSETVWTALRGLLEPDVQRLAELGFRSPASASSAVAFRRAASQAYPAASYAAAEPASPPEDVLRGVELLFTTEAAD